MHLLSKYHARRMRSRSVEPAFAATGRVVGQFERDGCGYIRLVKRGLDPRTAMLRRPPAWATDEEHIERLRELGGVGVRLELVTGEVLEATLDDFRRHGFDVSRGFGPQRALALPFWRRISGAEAPPNPQLFLFDVAEGGR